jgi:glycosyltransferase involved in cell wall biosynthesis
LIDRHVLVALHERDMGGASTALLRAFEPLAAGGWRFSFWVPAGGSAAAAVADHGWPLAGEERPLRYSWDALRQPPGAARRIRAAPGYLRRFRAHVARTAPDVVHLNTVLCVPEALAARSVGARTLVYVHEMIRGARGELALALMRAVDHAAAVSHASAAPLRARNIPVSVVTTGQVLAPVRKRRVGERVVVGTLATVSRRKGSDTFLAAAQALQVQWPAVEFRMVGSPAPAGPERDWALDIVARARAAGIVCHTAPDPLAELAEWDVFVLPSHADPFPLAVLEAMACGVPVVAAAVDGIPEQVAPDTGLLVAPGDERALATAIEALLSDPDRRLGLGAAGRARVAARFTPERHAHELAEAYDRACAPRGVAG